MAKAVQIWEPFLLELPDGAVQAYYASEEGCHPDQRIDVRTSMDGGKSWGTPVTVANNPGDWVLHCHMVHHMMNHMVKHVGPRMRAGASVDQYLANLDHRPQVATHTGSGFNIPGYPQKMQGMSMSEDLMKAIWSRREVQGMRANYAMAVKGLTNVLRVLPDDLYRLVMESDEKVEKGSIFSEIVRRFGDPACYEPAPAMHDMMS